MNTFKFKGGARLAATAGLGLTLALGVAPTVAWAESTTECHGGETCTHAAAINGTHYDTLQEAVEADGDIELLHDVILNKSVIIDPGDKVVIDGNEKTIKLENPWGGPAAYAAFSSPASGSTEGLKSGTTLRVTDATFKGHTDGKSDHVAVVAANASDVTVEFHGCVFENLHDAAYFNYVSDPDAARSSIIISGSTFTNVAHAYGVDDGATAGGRTDKLVIAVDKDAPEPETFAVATYNGVGYTDLQTAINAVSDESGDKTVQLLKDVAVSKQLELNKSGLTLDLNGHTITAANDFDSSYEQDSHLVNLTADDIAVKDGTIKATGNNRHALNVFGADSVSLVNMVLDHSAGGKGAPLMINDSTVTSSGKLSIITGANSWYGINVDNKGGDGASLTFDQNSSVSFDGEQKLGIYFEGNKENVEVSFGENCSVSTVGDGFVVVAGKGKVENPENAGLVTDENGIIGKPAAYIEEHAYLSIQDAINNAQAGDTITLAPGEHRLAPGERIVLNKKVTIKGDEDNASILTGSSTSGNGEGLITFAGGSEGSCLQGFTINYSANTRDCAAVYFGAGFAASKSDEVAKVEDMTFVGSDGASGFGQEIGILSDGARYGFVEVSGCSLSGFKYGMYFNGVDKLKITDNEISNIKYNGINVSGASSSVEISGNELENVSTENYKDVVYSSGISIGPDASGVEISGNSISMANGKVPVYVVDNDDGSTYVITYKVDGADYAVIVAKVEGGKVSYGAPADPSKSGYTFTGWNYGSANVSVSGGTATLIPTVGDSGNQFTFDATFSKDTPSNPGGGSSTVTKHKVTVADAEGGEVKVTPTSAKKGDTVTIAAAPDDGMKVDTVTVKDASGKAIEVEAGKDAGTWTFEMPGSAVTVTVTFADAWENPFSDVSEDDWFYGAVREAHKLGLMKGIEGTDLFSPLSGAFREQAATVMWNWLGEGDLEAPAAPFTDVLQGEWYAPYVNWANEAGVMTGYDGTGAFGVGESLTREQFASMVARAAGADLDAVDTSVLDSFGDADGVSPWAETAMAWAVDAGVISGVETDDGSRELQAARGITRAEMAQMIVNTVKSGVVA